MMISFWISFTIGCSLSDAEGTLGGTSTEIPNNIAGTVVDTAGVPVENASVYLLKGATWVDAVVKELPIIIDSTTTNAQGSYVVESENKGLFNLSIEYQTQGTVVYDVLVDSTSIQYDSLDAIQLQQRYSYQGIAKSTMGNVESVFLKGTQYSAPVNKDGTFRFTGIPKGEYQLVQKSTLTSDVHLTDLGDVYLDADVWLTVDTIPVDTVPDDTVDIDTIPLDTTRSFVLDTVTTITNDTLADFDRGIWCTSTDPSCTKGYWLFRIGSVTWTEQEYAESYLNETFESIYSLNTANAVSGQRAKLKPLNDDPEETPGVLFSIDDSVLKATSEDTLSFYIRGEGVLDFKLIANIENDSDVDIRIVEFLEITLDNEWREIKISLSQLTDVELKNLKYLKYRLLSGTRILLDHITIKRVAHSVVLREVESQ